MRSSGLKSTSLSVWHWLLLKALTFDLALNPLFLIHAVCALNGEFSSLKEQSKGCKSRRRGSRYPKLSRRQVWVGWLTIWSKPNHVVCTDEQKLHTEAMRSDEVTHAAEVQNSEMRQYRNSRCSSDRQKDIRLTEGDLELWKYASRSQQKS